MVSSESGFPQFLSAPSCRSKVVIRSASVSKGGLRTLLLNSGDQITKIYQGLYPRHAHQDPRVLAGRGMSCDLLLKQAQLRVVVPDAAHVPVQHVVVVGICQTLRIESLEGLFPPDVLCEILGVQVVPVKQVVQPVDGLRPRLYQVAPLPPELPHSSHPPPFLPRDTLR